MTGGMRREPMFSVIMPTYNSARFVREAIGSVVAQSWQDWELIIVDDGSSDETPELLRKASSQDQRIRTVFRAENGGPAEARNIAITAARGRFISFLDSDDVWRADKLEVQRDMLVRTDSPLVYSAYEKIDELGARLGRYVQVPESVTYQELLGATVIATCTATYDTQRVGKVLMPSIRMRQDFGLWLRLLRDGGVALGSQEPLALLRKRAGSVSSNKFTAISYTWKVYRDLERLPVSTSLYFFSKYLARAMQKSRI